MTNEKKIAKDNARQEMYKREAGLHAEVLMKEIGASKKDYWKIYAAMLVVMRKVPSLNKQATKIKY